MGTDRMLVHYEELFQIGLRSLELVGVPEGDAKITVDVLLRADMRGVGTHGIQRLMMYIPRLRKGLINPHPEILVKPLSPSMKMVYGDDGLGPVVATRGMKEDEMRVIAQCVARVIDGYRDKAVLEKVKQKIMELVKDFPIYPDFGVLE